MNTLKFFQRNATVTKSTGQRGFTLLELMVSVAVIGLLAAIALPSYRQYIVRAARVQAQTELLQFAGVQEKIYLNASSYALSVLKNYDGTATGGLGRTTGSTKDGLYTLSLVESCTSSTALVAGAQTFGLKAVPVVTASQAGDGTLCVSESGLRVWGSTTW